MRHKHEPEGYNIVELFDGGEPLQCAPIGGVADVNAVIRHHIDELAQECGEDDEYVRYMRSTLTATILPFPISDEGAEPWV